LHKFDQFQDNRNLLKQILKNDKIDICIDDGVHREEAILATMNSIKPYLAKDFIYFIEDNSIIHKTIKKIYPNFKVENFGKMSVIYLKKHYYG